MRYIHDILYVVQSIMHTIILILCAVDGSQFSIAELFWTVSGNVVFMQNRVHLIY